MPRPARPRPTNLSHPHYQPPFPASVSLYTCGEVETGNSQPSASSRSINYHSNRSINYRGHSYHCLLLRCSRSDQIADHNEPGGDPDPHLQGRTGMRREHRNRLDKIEPRANGALGVVLMRLGIAEIGEYAVAHVFCDETTIALDQFRAAAVISADDAPQVFGVEPS